MFDRPGVVAVSLALVLSACGSALGEPPSPTPAPAIPSNVVSSSTLAAGSLDNANGGFPAQVAGEDYPGIRTTARGMVRLAGNGCWYLSANGAEAMIVFPTGATIALDSTGTEVTLASGAKVPDGSTVEGAAALVDASDLPGIPDSYWGFITSFCAAGGSEVIVFDDMAVLTPARG